MIAHTLTLVLRSFQRSKLTLLFNLAGLSVAFTASLVIYLWLSDELSVDKFHQNDDRLFQVVSNVSNNGIVSMREPTPIGLAHVLTTELPEVEYASIVTPLHWFPKFIVKKDNIKIKCEGKFVGRDFLKIFSYPLLTGRAEDGLTTKQSILLSTTTAKKLFGSIEDAIGKTLHWELTDIKREGTVTGVFADIPKNSTDQFEIIFALDMLRDIMGFAENDMNAFGPHTFITVPEGIDIADFNKKMDRLIKIKRPDLKADSFYLVKYSSRYLYGNFENGVQQGGRITYVKIFSMVGLAIVLLACINFVNLSTAASVGRLKETGVRKIIGASRLLLAVKSIAESIILCLISMVISVLSLFLLLPGINEALEKQLMFPSDFLSVSIITLVAICIGLLAGVYPAVYLTGVNPVSALRGKSSVLTPKSFSRQALVIFQCSVSVFAIFFAIIIHAQISFIQSKSLGFDKENVIYFENEGEIAKDANAFIASLKEIPGVVNASSMIGTFTGMAGPPQVISIDNKQIPLQLSFVNYDLIETMGIELSAGRTFRKELDDVDKIVLNEKAVAALGMTDPINKIIPFGSRQVEIIGVVKDFHLVSLHQQIIPLVFQLETRQHWNIVARLDEKNQRSTISRIEQRVQKFNPGLPLDYRFLEDELNRQYKTEERIGFLSAFFSALAIFISVLGLLSLASFVCQKRVKEIGIRKVVGASPKEILTMLASYFVNLSIVAIIISLPLGFFIAKEWLTNFAYGIQIELWMFLAAAGVALFLMLGTIGGFVIRASRTNPASTLKND